MLLYNILRKDKQVEFEVCEEDMQPLRFSQEKNVPIV